MGYNIYYSIKLRHETDGNHPDMIKKTKRIFCAASFVVVLAAQLCACSSLIVIHDNPQADETAQSTETAVPDTQDTGADTKSGVESDTDGIPTDTVTAESAASPADPAERAKAALVELRRADLDGMNYLIAASDRAAVFGDSFDGEEAGSTVLPATRIARTRLVEEKYNVRILTFSYDPEELYQEIRAAYLSDTQYFADFYAIPSSEVGRYQTAGLLFNLRSLPFTDYSADYFDGDAMNAFSAGNGIWAAAGDYTFSPENYHAVYYNKTLNEKLGLTSPYDQVKGSTWTWDTLLANAAVARGLADRDGNFTYFGDNFSSFSLTTGEALVLASSGQHMISSGLDRIPALSADTDALGTVVSVIKNAVSASATSPTASQYTDAYPDAESLFLGGKLLYYCGNLANLRKWADSETVWGLLPLPKISEGQKSYGTYAGDSAVLCVPSTVGDPEATGTILQALFAASAGTYPEIYLGEALAYYVRDGESVDMLELICGTVTYDFAASFASGYSYTNYATLYALHSAVTQGYSLSSMYQNYKTSAASELAKAFPVR